MIYTSLSLLTWIFFLVLIPIFNPKNKGQSLGKMILKITPLYLDAKNKNLKIIIREIPILILFASGIVLTMITGYNTSYIISNIKNSEFSNDVAKLSNDEILRSSGFSDFVVTMYIIKSIWNFIAFIGIIVLFVMIASNPQKRGPHDKMANVAIVDLKTKITIVEAEIRFNQMLKNFYPTTPPQQDFGDQNFNNEPQQPTNDIILPQTNEVDNNNNNDNNNNEVILEKVPSLEENLNPEIIEDELTNVIIEPKKQDYSNLTVAKIKEILNEEKIEFKSNMKKQDLIDLLDKKK